MPDSPLRRAVDVAVAGLGLLACAPLLVLLAVLVRITSPGRVLFRQLRVGRDEEQFEIVKLRTMVAAPGGAPLVSGTRDPRVTRVGGWLRLSRLDELPQLINVLRGQMTLVGPRPEVARFVASYTAQERELFQVRPGIIGPGAVLFVEQARELEGVGDPERYYVAHQMHPRLALDLDYMRHRGLRSDVRIVCRALAAVAGATVRRSPGRLRTANVLKLILVGALASMLGGAAGPSSAASTVTPSALPGYATAPLEAPALPRVAPPSAAVRPLVGPAVMHYAPNSNFDVRNRFLPSAVGFTLADVASRQALDLLPHGVRGLVYLGMCSGADAAFQAAVLQFAADPRLFGFYLIDEPDPKSCAASNLAAESAFIHARLKGATVFVVLQNLSSSRDPSFLGGYTKQNTRIDLFGIATYPCRSELNGCDPGMIDSYVRAAVSAGIPTSDIVPVYQSFGGGSWVDDGGGHYVLPTAEEARMIICDWASLIPQPVFDYTYSWGSQRGDQALGTSPPELKAVFSAHNASRLTC